jgi:hypothetical protein
MVQPLGAIAERVVVVALLQAVTFPPEFGATGNAFTVIANV